MALPPDPLQMAMEREAQSPSSQPPSPPSAPTIPSDDELTQSTELGPVELMRMSANLLRSLQQAIAPGGRWREDVSVSDAKALIQSLTSVTSNLMKFEQISIEHEASIEFEKRIRSAFSDLYGKSTTHQKIIDEILERVENATLQDPSDTDEDLSSETEFDQ